MTQCNFDGGDRRSDEVAPVASGSTLLFALSVAIIVLPLFAPQPLVGLIGSSLDLAPAYYGAVAILSMLGYASGLVLLTPLIDILENRRLILSTVATGCLAVGVAAAAPSLWLFMAAIFLAGVATSAIQMLVPFAGLLAPESQRGRTIGNVMSGLMFGILVSRPIASLMADAWGWRGSYVFCDGCLLTVLVALAFLLPARLPKHPADTARFSNHYGAFFEIKRCCVGVPCINPHACLPSASSGLRSR